MAHWARDDPHRRTISILLLLALTAGLLGLTALAPRTADPASAPPDTLMAFAYAMPNQGWAPLRVYLSPFGSRALTGGIVRYEWDLDGDGTFETDATAELGYTQVLYSEHRVYAPALRITNEQGQAATASTQVEVRHPASSSIDYWTVFDDRRVRDVELRLTQADWDALQAAPTSKARVPAEAIVFGERLASVAASLKGNSSITVPGWKKPWKIDTDYFIAGQEYRNLKQLLFHNNFADASMLREKLAYDMMRFAGVPAGHAAYVTLSLDITDDDQPPIYLGVYTMVERVDAKFVDNRFGRDQGAGNLYKADAWFDQGAADLAYYGEDILRYPRPRGELAYHLQTNLDQPDYTHLIELTRILDGTDYVTDEEFAAALESVFNVDGFLRYLAVIFTNLNLDTYPYTGNNYYLYDDPSTGRFQFIAWDLNNSWGHFGGQFDFPLYGAPCCQGPLEWAPLFTRLLQREDYRRDYAAYVDLLTRHWFNAENVGRLASQWQTLIRPHLMRNGGDRMYVGADAQFALHQFTTDGQALVDLTAARSEYLQEVLESGEWETLVPEANDPPEGKPGLP
jgi:hypothetical protein